MKRRAIGRTGLLVSAVGLGTSNFGGRLEAGVAHAVVQRALELGVTLFDCADSYGNGRAEEVLGEALGEERKNVFVSTKWGNFDRGGWGPKPAVEQRGGSRGYIVSSLEHSLRRLRTDYIDLYQLHMPDVKTPIEETLRTLEDVTRQGKVRYAGVSNMPAWQIVEAQLIARELGVAGFVSFQDRYSLLERDIETTMLPATERYGLSLLPYHPLAEGLLTGKYRREAPVPPDSRLATWSRMRERSVTEENWEIVERLRVFAEERGHTLLQLAMSWLASRESVGCILPGATKPEQVERNVAAVNWELSDEELTMLHGVTRKPVTGASGQSNR